MQLAMFQQKAVAELMAAMHGRSREILLKSCTGSGKTIILTRFMAQWAAAAPDCVFVWLTPGKGELERQSKAKMDRYVPGSHTKLLADVLAAGFAAGDACFINWEKLNKKGSNALREGEQANLLDRVAQARAAGLRFVVLVDESHQNDTVKSADILRCFAPEKIIRCSATPRRSARAKCIEVPEAAVIAEGLIKKRLIINEGFADSVQAESQLDYLLGQAEAKREQLARAYQAAGAAVHPLVIVQLPNKSDAMLHRIEEWYGARGVRCDNGRLAVWLADRHEGLAGIEKNDAPQQAVIIKQAVATGWDCPRAQILVKLRDNMNETFEIQTIGRIRRMPEAHHYGSDLLDSCYLYTLDERFTAHVKQSLGHGALEAVTLALKPSFRDVHWPCERLAALAVTRDPAAAWRAIGDYFAAAYGTGPRTAENAALLAAAGYEFSPDILEHTKSGAVDTLDADKIAALADITVRTALNTHVHGRMYQHAVAEMGLQLGLEYAQMNTILRRLLDKNLRCSGKILALDTRQLYAFVLNNTARLRADVRRATEALLGQQIMEPAQASAADYHIPRTCLFTYDGGARAQTEMRKNVYAGYLSSAETRTPAERALEQLCERCRRVEWVYRNLDGGPEAFGFLAETAPGRLQPLYPDYVVSVDGALWVLDAKTGLDRLHPEGDPARKQAALGRSLHKYGLQGGLVRTGENGLEWLDCTGPAGDWQPLEAVLAGQAPR